jgi:acyl-CoA thioesterase
MSEGRGLLRGSITRPDGALAASFAQEVVVPG